MIATRVLPAALTLALVAGVAQAHTMWLNLATDETAQQAIVWVAYGDYMPGSELLSTDWGEMSLAEYDLVGPDGVRSALGLPVIEPRKGEPLRHGMVLTRGGDVGMRKLAFGPEAKPGTYQVAARSELFRYVHYRDTRGKDQYSDRPAGTIDDVAEVIDTSLEIFFLKTSFTVGAWTDPAPLGQLLEIVPLSDLTAVRAGDVIRFRVLLEGGAWIPDGGGAQITAHNSAFGDRWSLYSPLKFGEGEFRVPQAGLWRIDARVDGLAGDFPGLGPIARDADGKLPIVIWSSFVVNVRP